MQQDESDGVRNGTLIIGGGVIGLGIGWKLAMAGEPVTLLERGEAGRQASWAAAGMLAPATEVHFQEEMHLQLGLESLRLYPDFVRELEAFTGRPVDYRTEGALAVALNADESAELRHLYDYQREKGLPVEWLNGERVQALEPSLSHSVAAGVRCAMDHQVDNRKLVATLKVGFLQAGGVLHEHTEVTHVQLREDGPPSVEADGREWRYERVLLAAGSWSGLIPGLSDSLRPLVRPVKGQMLAVQAPSEDFLQRIVRTPDCYMVPRLDGRIIVGATVEEMGFDPALTVGGLYELLRGAWRAVPGMYDLPVLETWTGFRPGSRDNAPLMGATDIPGFFIATGHYRNGILNTPVTAHYMSRLILEGQTPEFLQRFSPQRFSSPSA